MEDVLGVLNIKVIKVKKVYIIYSKRCFLMFQRKEELSYNICYILKVLVSFVMDMEFLMFYLSDLLFKFVQELRGEESFVVVIDGEGKFLGFVIMKDLFNFFVLLKRYFIVGLDLLKRYFINRVFCVEDIMVKKLIMIYVDENLGRVI